MNKIIHAIFGKKNSPSQTDRCPAQVLPVKQYISNSFGGWEPVGFDEKLNYVILSRKTGGLVTLSPRSLEENTLRAVVGSQYCDENCLEHDSKLEKEVFSPALLAEKIREKCDERGLVDLSRIRSPGFYMDAGKLSVNFGNEVYQANGEPIDTTPGAAVYVSGQSLGFSFDTPAATQKEIAQLLDAVKGFRFQTNFGALALLGWFATAVFGSVVDNRPILAVTAERGAGKTTLIELLSSLLGPQAYRRDGVPSVAQVIYELEGRSAALLVDEFEAQGTQKKPLEDFLSLMRTSFTKSKHARIVRVIAGKQRSFNPPAGVLVAGIALPTFDDASNTRTVRVQMQTLSADTPRVPNPMLDLSNRDETEAFGARVRRLLISRWNNFSTTQKMVRGMLIDLGHEARAADLHSPLIAGYAALTSDSLLSAQELKNILEECQLTTVEEKNIQRDYDVCVSILLNRRIVIFEEVGGKPVKSHKRIREIICRIIDSDLDIETRQGLIRQLEKFGLRPMWKRDANEWKLIVATSETNGGLRRLMQGTPWFSGGLKDVLLRLPGAVMGQQRVDGMSQKVVELCLTADLISPDFDGEYELPAAA